MCKAGFQTPFGRLIRLFLGRILHGGGDEELDSSAGLVLSLLSLPGGFYSIFLLEKYSTLYQWMLGAHLADPLASALPDEYFFIVLSMAVTGIVAVWRWDSIFPDRRDYANLVPLPLPTRNIFIANLAAILFLAGLLAIDVNAFSAFLFPFAISASEQTFSFFGQFVGIHWFVVGLASIFSFFAIFLVVGLLMVAMPYAAFRRTSLYARASIMLVLVTMLSTSFAVPAMVRQSPKGIVRFLPPVWFLGLCQTMRGKATPSLAAFGRLALASSGMLILATGMVYAISYRRCFVRIPEVADKGPSNDSVLLRRIFRALDRTILNTPFQRAGYRFVIKTLLRSQQHALILGGFTALGIVTASQFLFASYNARETAIQTSLTPGVLAIPLILSYCILLGVRFSFDIPTDLQANWIFRLSIGKTTHECIPMAMRVMASLTIPWIFAIVLPIYAYTWGWRAGLLETAVTALWSLLLSEILLLNFRKVPFTCTPPPFRASSIVKVLSYLLGFFVFVVMTSHLVYWSLLSPISTLALVAIALGLWGILSRLRQEIQEIDKELIFEDAGPAAFDLLELGRGT
jgi:hypothetical protein